MAGVGRAVIIELVGPAGVGKTAVSKALADRYDARRSSIWSLPRRALLLPLLEFLPLHWRLVWAARAPVIREMKHLVRLRALRERLSRHADTLPAMLVLDEGPVFVQAWLSVLGHHRLRNGRSLSWRDSATALWPSPLDLVVVLEADDRVLASRIRGRPKPHGLKKRSDEAISRFVTEFRYAFERVLAAGGQATRTLRLSTTDQTSAQIADRIWQETRGGTGG